MSYLLTGLDQSRITLAPAGLPPYSWRGVCRIGGCSNPATDPHHVVPRSRTGGPVRYVLIDDEPWPNVLGLCRRHHDKLTSGVSILVWQDEPRGYAYTSPQRSLVRLRAFGHGESMAERGGACCALCGQSPPRPRPWELAARRRGRFVISAPTDRGEDGPDILASLTEQVAEKIGLDRPGSSSAAYHAVLTSLSAVLLHDDALEGLRHHYHGEDR